MSVNQLFQSPPVRGTDISVQSISLAGGDPFDNYMNTTLDTTFFFAGITGSSLGTGTSTGTLELSSIGDQYFINVPQYTGTVGVTASYLISTSSLPTEYIPSTRQFSPSILVSNGSAYNSAICSIETDGKIRFFNREGIFPGMIGNCEIESQVISYHI